MDTSEYMPMFLAESREHLQELNLAVVRIEETPDDRETLDEIFRIAHSLKGMSATMGFARIAALTHEMEDVFELLRGRTEGVGREAIDVLLECLDALSGAVESIDEEGAESLDPGRLIARLESLLRDEDAAARAQASAGAAPSDRSARGTRRRLGRPRASRAGCRRDDAVGARLHGARRARRPRRADRLGALARGRRDLRRLRRSRHGWRPTTSHSAIEKTVLGVPDVGARRRARPHGRGRDRSISRRSRPPPRRRRTAPSRAARLRPPCASTPSGSTS